MSDIIWLHEDALRDDHPVFDAAEPGAMVCFVWDDEYLQAMDYGFKRLLFIYETLLELPLAILHGNQVACLSALAGEHNGRILVPETPNPRLQQTIATLGENGRVEVVEDRPFVTLARAPDLHRFFRYWNTARKLAMTPGGGR